MKSRGLVFAEALGGLATLTNVLRALRGGGLGSEPKPKLVPRKISALLRAAPGIPRGREGPEDTPVPSALLAPPVPAVQAAGISSQSLLSRRQLGTKRAGKVARRR